MTSQPVIVRTISNTTVRTKQVDSSGMEYQVVVDLSARALTRPLLQEFLDSLCRHCWRWSHGLDRHEAGRQSDLLFDALAEAIADWVEARVPGASRLVVHRPHGGESLEYSWPVTGWQPALPQTIRGGTNEKRSRIRADRPGYNP